MQGQNERAAIVESCSLFDGLPTRERRALASASDLQYLRPRETLFVEGEQGDTLQVLGSGRIKLFHAAPDGRESIVEFAAAGSPLLLGALLDGRPLTASAMALTEASVLRVPRAVFLTAVAADSGVVVAALCSELRRRDIDAGVGSLKDASARIACRLLQMSRRYGERSGGGTRVDYPLSRLDLGRASGVTVETAVRTLSGWRRDGLVATERGSVVITDVSGLRERAGCEPCLHDCSVFDARPSSV